MRKLSKSKVKELEEVLYSAALFLREGKLEDAANEAENFKSCIDEILDEEGGNKNG